ncbi:MAG: hypothetical protein AB7I37_02505 [Pirellulales bacterium]
MMKGQRRKDEESGRLAEEKGGWRLTSGKPPAGIVTVTGSENTFGRLWPAS